MYKYLTVLKEARNSQSCPAKGLGAWKISCEHNENNFFCTLRVIEHWNWLPRELGGASNPENTPNPTGHSPEKPAVFDPALSKGIRQDDLQRSIPTSSFLFYDSEKLFKQNS